MLGKQKKKKKKKFLLGGYKAFNVYTLLLLRHSMMFILVFLRSLFELPHIVTISLHIIDRGFWSSDRGDDQAETADYLYQGGKDSTSFHNPDETPSCVTFCHCLFLLCLHTFILTLIAFALLRSESTNLHWRTGWEITVTAGRAKGPLVALDRHYAACCWWRTTLFSKKNKKKKSHYQSLLSLHWIKVLHLWYTAGIAAAIYLLSGLSLHTTNLLLLRCHPAVILGLVRIDLQHLEFEFPARQPVNFPITLNLQTSAGQTVPPVQNTSLTIEGRKSKPLWWKHCPADWLCSVQSSGGLQAVSLDVVSFS